MQVSVLKFLLAAFAVAPCFGQTGAGPDDHCNYKITKLVAKDDKNDGREASDEDESLKLTDWGSGRSSTIDATSEGDEGKDEPKWTGWDKDSQYDKQKTANWWGSLPKDKNTTITCGECAGSKRVKIDLFDGNFENQFTFKGSGTGSEIIKAFLGEKIPGIGDHWNGAADFTKSYYYCDYYKDGTKIGFKTKWDIRNIQFGYDKTDVTLPSIPIPNTPVTITPKVELADMKATFSGSVEYDDSLENSFVKGEGTLSGDSTVTASATADVASVFDLRVSGSGKVHLSGSAEIKDGKLVPTDLDAKIDKFTGEVSGEIKLGPTKYKVFDDKFNFPSDGVEFHKHFPDDKPTPNATPTPLFDPEEIRRYLDRHG